jgi:hypothetical protein
MSSSSKVSEMRAPIVGSRRVVRVIVIALLLGVVIGFAYWGSTPGGDILAADLAAPLNGATTAKVDIDAGTGHLAIDRLATGEQALASGTLQYLKSQGVPSRSLNASNGQATLTLRGGNAGQPLFRLPWAACGGAYEWQVRLNPSVPDDLTAHSAGGNVQLNLAKLAITRLAADTAGGNADVVLPDNAANLRATVKTGGGNVTVEVGSGITGNNSVDANTGAGNVIVHVPSGLAARIHATSGLGKVTVDQRFSQIDGSTYQSPEYDGAANRVEITVGSGAGNVSVTSK